MGRITYSSFIIFMTRLNARSQSKCKRTDFENIAPFKLLDI